MIVILSLIISFLIILDIDLLIIVHEDQKPAPVKGGAGFVVIHQLFAGLVVASRVAAVLQTRDGV